MGPIIGAVVGVVLLLAVGALWFYRRSKLSETKPSGGVDSPPKPLEPIKARPEEEATAIAIASKEGALSGRLARSSATMASATVTLCFSAPLSATLACDC